MENKVLQHLDRMITQHEMLLTGSVARRAVVPADLSAEIKRLEKGLYALREGVHGLVRARECGFPLERIDHFLESLESVAVAAEKALLDAIARLDALPEKGKPAP